MNDDLPGYDTWKTRLPPEPYSDDPACTCTSERMDGWCEVHGRDPDQAYLEYLDLQADLRYWEDELDRRESEFDE